ncbi:hypothetical protein E2C01_028100 [Portunus trituberculatus]|uniref:Uncharacterized protein n=1 Tax=Portunus trituberculatus TaxID=210409 RepID=A0A5B7EKH0_PORTR|nr:hypothetical protein [Portunus trituberculatus]
MCCTRRAETVTLQGRPPCGTWRGLGFWCQCQELGCPGDICTTSRASQHRRLHYLCQTSPCLGCPIPSPRVNMFSSSPQPPTHHDLHLCTHATSTTTRAPPSPPPSPPRPPRFTRLVNFLLAYLRNVSRLIAVNL